MTLQIAIADQELFACEHLRALLLEHQDVEVLCAAQSTSALLEGLQGRRADALFLDLDHPDAISMPMLAPVLSDRPSLVFLTAHGQYSQNAGDFTALDYLLKPFQPEHLDESLRRVRAKTLPPVRYAEKLALPMGRRTEIVPVEEIDYLRAHANYVAVHVGPREFVLRSTMADMQAQLDPQSFLRVHRSFIVRTAAITQLRAIDSGRYRIGLGTGQHIQSGRSARQLIRAQLGLN
ncbi:response regulator transcription factor [bacterium]|nr:response regulator transcription factor [bacterium]